MSDLAKYEALLAAWREKETIAETMRAFRDAGGQHRLRVSFVMADPAHAAVAEPLLAASIGKTGWARLIEIGIKHADADAATAKAALR